MEPPLTAIAARLAAVRARMEAACRRAGRDPSAVTLVAVSKTHPPAAIEAAHAAGQRDFGENYAQELRDKAQALPHLGGLRWHAIGRLQANKARYVAKVAAMFHALDDAAVAREVGRRAVTAGRTLACLMEVNPGEAQKGGVPLAEVPALLSEVRPIQGLEIRGLMAMTPLGAEPGACRALFARVRDAAHANGLSELSMGMTQDFEIAIQEGATIVRVGTAIFGKRT